MKSKIKKSIKIAFLFALLFIEISCEKKKPIELDKRPIDANAHIYDTIQIGEQVWMKQNFRGSKFIDSSDIPNNLNHEVDIFQQ